MHQTETWRAGLDDNPRDQELEAGAWQPEAKTSPCWAVEVGGCGPGRRPVVPGNCVVVWSSERLRVVVGRWVTLEQREP